MKRLPSTSRRLAWQALILYQRSHEEPGRILRALLPSDLSKSELDLAWELTNGAIRYQKKLDYIAQSLIKAPLRRQKPEIVAALRLGLYQLTETSGIPDFAAVHETVELIKDTFSAKEAGFVNAVLRNFARESIAYPDKDKDPVSYLSIFYSYPEWLVRRWLDRFGIEETESILKAGNVRRFTGLKVITSRISADEIIRNFQAEKIDVQKSDYFPDYLRCGDISSVIKSEIFNSGLVNIQDESQGLAVHLLDVPKGAVALDLCSAPGGKTIALADAIGSDGKVVSMDANPERLKELRGNVERTGFKNIDIIEEDLFEFASNGKFKYILLDVPCSGLGNIGSKADLRWAKSEKEIATLATLQARMLRKVSTLLADDGVLVYSTCTTEPDEIENVVDEFIRTNPEYELADGNSSLVVPFNVRAGIYRCWTHKHGIAGGGFARLVKRYGSQNK